MNTITKMIAKSKTQPQIREVALIITDRVVTDTTGLPDRRNFQAIAEAIYGFIVSNIAYTRDPHEVERVSDAATILMERSGDCDDMVVLGASLLQTLGIPVRLVTIATNPLYPNAYSHIYFEYQLGTGEWMPFDATLEDGAAGWLPPSTDHMQKKIWTMSGNSIVIPSGSSTNTDDASANVQLSDCGCGSAGDKNLGFLNIFAPIAGAVDVISGGPKQRAREAARNLETAEQMVELETIRMQALQMNQEQTIKNVMVIGGITAAAGITGLIIYKIL